MNEEQGTEGPLGSCSMAAKTTSNLPMAKEESPGGDAATKKTAKTSKTSKNKKKCLDATAAGKASVMCKCDVTFCDQHYLQ